MLLGSGAALAIGGGVCLGLAAASAGEMEDPRTLLEVEVAKDLGERLATELLLHLDANPLSDRPPVA